MQSDFKAKRLPYFWSFILFFLVCILTLSVLFGAVFGNSRRIADAFMDKTYVDRLYEDVQLYAADLCLEYGLDEELAQTVVRTDVEAALSAYVDSALRNASEADHKRQIDAVVQKLKAAVQQAAPSASEEDLNTFSEDFEAYFIAQTEFIYMDNVRAFSDLSTKISVAGAVTGCLLLAGVAAALARSGVDRREKLLLAGDAVCAAGITTFLFTVVMMLLKSKKNIYIFPSYLSDAVTDYIMDCLKMNLAAAAVLIAASIGMMLFALKGRKDVKL